VRGSLRSLAFFALIVVVTAAAAAIRLPKLAQRPMHTDEAVHAAKFAELLEDGQYIYDPYEYHGPTLNYFTLIPAWLSKRHNYQQIDERTVRVVPVVFGVLVVLLVVGVADGLGRTAALAAAMLAAVSHAMVFYSRYYIQEMLLVFFTFCLLISGWRYFKSRRLVWALLAGASLAFMHATKETFIIPLGAMLLALFLTILLNGRGAEARLAAIKKINLRHLWLAIVAAIVISAVLFSCGFQNLRGIFDSVATYKIYFERAGHNTPHIHPWYYYLRMLAWFKIDGGTVWTESLILLLAGIGMAAALCRKGLGAADGLFVRFVAFYAVILTIVYSLIPYKTPWCMLGFLHAWILLAGIGVVVLLHIAPRRWPRTLIVILLLQGAAHLAWQAASGAFRYYDDHSNPYVYAHTGRDIFTVVDRIAEMSDLHPDGKDMHVEIICPGFDHWPLPWYLRRYKNVGYYTEVDNTTMPAPVIVGYASLEKDILKKIFGVPPGQYNTYIPLFDDYIELRPTIELMGFVMWDLKDGRLKSHMAQEPVE